MPPFTRRISLMAESVENAYRQLRSDEPTERLVAARYFAAHATAEHERYLREALAQENVPWIRAALKRALARLSPHVETTSPPLLDAEDAPSRFAAQVYADALEEAASQLIHEVEPILGALRLAVEREMPDFENSGTRIHLDRLDGLLDAFARLRRAASAPKSEEFSLDELVQRAIQEVPIPEGVAVHKAGPQPFVVEGDSSLLALSLVNGLRNAVEATSALRGVQRAPITIAWGQTDIDYWVSVVDLGIGFKGNVQRAFEMGTSTKTGHLGMGLATAKQAMESLSGRLLLVPNPRGVRFEMRWPITNPLQ